MNGVSVKPVTITVSPDGHDGHRSIGAALAAAPDGATIEVHPGRYAESLVLARPVIIAAAEPAGAVLVEPPALLKALAGPMGQTESIWPIPPK